MLDAGPPLYLEVRLPHPTPSQTFYLAQALALASSNLCISWALGFGLGPHRLRAPGLGCG